MLDFEYGVNTGNRFLQFVDHDEEPEAFIAGQIQQDEPVGKKSSTKDSKVTTTKKVTTTAPKTNKENLTSKSNNERRQTTSATAVFSDNQNQQTRLDSARGSRGGVRRATGTNYDASNRGIGRSQRFQKFEGQQTTSMGTEDQTGRGRGRGGNTRRGNFDGTIRGRGGRGRGYFNNNRTTDDGTTQEQPTVESNLDLNDQDISLQEGPFEHDNNRRNNRGYFRPRTYPTPRDGTEMSQEDYRANRRLHDRQPRSNLSGVKPIEKKDGEGAHNWGNPTENPDEHLVSEEITEGTGQTAAAAASWAQQVDEAEKQMTLDEYKKQLEAKKRSQHEKVPQFKTRTAGEGEDPKVWTKPVQVYRKKNNLDQSDNDDEDEDEEGSVAEEQDNDDEEEEQMIGKKKLISIPLHFKPIETGRGSTRGGGRRGGNPRYRERSNRDEPAISPTEEQGPATGGDESRRGATGNYRRSYGNSARTSRSGRNQGESNALALDNPLDFPTLPKQ